MMRTGHQLAAATLALAVLPESAPLVAVAGTVAVATIFSHGNLSPDVDLRLPKVAHRGPTHTIEWVALACLAVILLARAVDHATGGWGIAWIGVGIALAWISHLIADGVFGGVPSEILTQARLRRRGSRLSRMPQRHRRSPTARRYRWRSRVGLKLRTGGRVERHVAYPLMIMGSLALIWFRWLH